MNTFRTLIISYDNYKEIVLFLNELVGTHVPFWFMNKQGKVRLRVPSMVVDIVRNKALEHNLEYIETVYEPEKYLFGGNESISIVNNILCDIAGISVRVKYLVNEKRIQEGVEDCFYLFLLNRMLQYSHFDDFETWDIWNKVCSHRQIDVKKYGEILMSKLYDVYCAISNKEFDILALDADNTICYVEDIKLQCDRLSKLAYSSLLSRGIRGIISSIIIFSFNMMGISAQKQCGFAQIMRILTGPDFRRYVGL